MTSVPEGAPQPGGRTLGTPFQERIGTILLVLAAMIVFAKLGATHLAAFDDCYYAQKAKEMVRSGDWFTPHFAGHPRWDNPPLFLWMMAANREDDDRQYGVVNVHPDFADMGSGLDKGRSDKR